MSIAAGFYTVYWRRPDEGHWQIASSYSSEADARARADRAAAQGLHAIVNDPDERQIYEVGPVSGEVSP